MSSREPLWYCHECHSEMRPLMVPDPVCSSCHGSFVEKMENPEDDPREFAHGDHGDFDPDTLPPGMDTFLLSLHNLMDRGMAPNAHPRNDAPPSGTRMTLRMTGGNGSRIVTFGGPSTLGPGPDRPRGQSGEVPTMSEFLGTRPRADGEQRITGPMMAQYLLALLGHQDPLATLLTGGLAGGVPENGRMGDYVFNQEALDQIITQIMENSNAHRPIAATEEIMNKLPRELLVVGSAILEQDCAVCKEQFKLETEDPDEQIVVTLPCKHPFHEPCIIPWLKSSGTCPVCRYALIAQPEHRPPPPASTTSPPTNSSSPPNSGRMERQPDAGGGIFQSIFGHLVGGHSSNQPNGQRTGNSQYPASPPPSSSQRRSPPHHGSNSGRTSSGSQRQNNGNNNNNGGPLPGGWADDLD